MRQAGRLAADSAARHAAQEGGGRMDVDLNFGDDRPAQVRGSSKDPVAKVAPAVLAAVLAWFAVETRMFLRFPGVLGESRSKAGSFLTDIREAAAAQDPPLYLGTVTWPVAEEPKRLADGTLDTAQPFFGGLERLTAEQYASRSKAKAKAPVAPAAQEQHPPTFVGTDPAEPVDESADDFDPEPDES